MTKDFEEEELSRGKKLACNLSSAGIVLAAGVFLLLCGTGVLKISVARSALGVMLAAVALVFVVSALISRNSVSLWLGLCFATPALVELLVCVTSAGYSNLYPLYIAIPAISSLFTMFYTREWRAHITVILLFGVTAGIFALGNIDGVGWSVIIPALVIYAGLIMTALAVRAKKKDDEDEN